MAYCYDPPGIRELRCGNEPEHCEDNQGDWYLVGACIATPGVPYSCRRCVSNSRAKRAMSRSGGGSGVRQMAGGGDWAG